MANIFISTNEQDVVDIKKRCSCDFPCNYTTKVNDINIIAFAKINSCFDNYFAKGDDFGIIIGTYIYKGKTGSVAIADIIEKFTSDMIPELKINMVGMWSACIHKNGHTYIFNDYYGLYDVCYTDNTRICIATNLGDIGSNISNNEIAEFPFMMEAFQRGSFPGTTIFKSIRKLLGTEYIEIKEGKLYAFDICDKLVINYSYISEQKAISDIVTMLIENAENVNSVIGAQSCFMTGGLDSRLIFGAFNKTNSNLECLFGQGSGSQKGDRILVEEISNYYKKKLRILDWGYNVKDSIEQQSEVFKQIDFNNWIGGGYKPHIDLFASCSKVRPFYAFGYFCEAIRLRDWAEKKGNTFSLIDYVDNYYINSQLNGVYDNYTNYRTYLIEEFKKQLNSIGISSNYENIPIDLFERFRWIMARFCDSRTEFMLNKYGYSFSIMSIPQIHEAILSLPAEVIKGGSFQIKVINELDSRLIEEFDVFSHLRPYRINNNFRKVRKISLKSIGDDIFTLFPSIKPYLIKLYRNKRYRNKMESNQDILFLEPLEHLIPDYVKYKNYDGTLTRLKSIIIGLYNINIR